MVTIYALKDPDTSEIRYIGQSKNVHMRYGTHINAARKGKSDLNGSYKEWMDDLRKRGKDPVLEVLEEVEDADAGRAERRLIRCHMDSGHLVNNRLPWGREEPDDSIVEYMKKVQWSKEFWALIHQIHDQYGEQWIEQMTTELVNGNRDYASLDEIGRRRLDMLEVWHRYVVNGPRYMLVYLFCRATGIAPIMPRD